MRTVVMPARFNIQILHIKPNRAVRPGSPKFSERHFEGYCCGVVPVECSLRCMLI